jgi:hypothetical protein
VLGQWAAVMLNADMYAEVIDRHVELAGDVTWVAGLLDSAHPPVDRRRQQRARSSPALQIEGDPDGEWLADRMVVIAQLAERLDRETLELALRIVPVDWWWERLGTGAPSSPGVAPRRSSVSEPSAREAGAGETAASRHPQGF